ncbi:MAG: 16S rRNA (cytosine(967)-C(5))-methyltransferase RsmB, partial [Pseudomonadota bacterium]
ASLVNGILRAYLREAPAIEDSDDSETRQNHPRWLIDRLRADWPDDWQSILAANNTRAPMWLRVNRQRSATADYLARLQSQPTTAASAAGHLEPGLAQAIRLEQPLPVDALPDFDEGAVSVQDAAAQLAAPWLLGGESGVNRRILDLCAAPGGKTAHLLELAGAGADVTALDSDAGRLERVHGTLNRLGLAADVRAADAADLDAWWDGRPYDSILLDAPCSASGVIRRHPDIKHLRRADDVRALALGQRRLLDAAWLTLRPGGRLLYVTCSVFAAENQDVVDAFLARHADAIENRLLPNNNIQALMLERSSGFQVLPGTRAMDGFYFACLEKRA